MKSTFRTALIGLGKIGAGNASDVQMAKYYPYATHAQVLRDHPRFEWVAGVDLEADVLAMAQRDWGFPDALTDVRELRDLDIDVAVIATPPAARSGILEALPRLRGMVVEKPLGRTQEETSDFIRLVEERALLTQVALWRRSDTLYRELAAGGLRSYVGLPQAVFATYGNGFRNNGSHVVDFLRMLFGEIAAVVPIPSLKPVPAGPIPRDVQMPFSLRMESGLVVAVQALDFGAYREVGLDVWGTEGRLTIFQEGLAIRQFPRCENRSTTGEFEIATDAGTEIPSTVGTAFYEIFESLAQALDGLAPLTCPIRTAAESEEWVDRILRECGG